MLERRIKALKRKMPGLIKTSVQEGSDVESLEDKFKEIFEKIEQLKKRISAIRESQNSDSSLEDNLTAI